MPYLQIKPKWIKEFNGDAQKRTREESIMAWGSTVIYCDTKGLCPKTYINWAPFECQTFIHQRIQLKEWKGHPQCCRAFEENLSGRGLMSRL